MSVTLTGDAKYAEFLEKYPRRVRRDIKAEYQNVAERIIKLAQDNLSAGSGKYGTPAIDTESTYQGFKVEYRKIEAYNPFETEIKNEAPQASYVEYGTVAHFPPPNALAGWADRHGFDTDDSTLFVLARAIARNPQPARPFFIPAFKQGITELNQNVIAILKNPSTA